jgi:hypothetical protein
MEYDNLHCGSVVPTLADMDANHRLANVQQMLRQPHLVSDAIRSSHARHTIRHDILLSYFGRCHQYSTDEDFQCGSQ